MRGRYSGVRDQAIGGILTFVREITPYLAIYNLYSNRLSGEHVIFWGIDSVNKKREKREAEAGKIVHCRV